MLAVARATAALCALIGAVWAVCSGTRDSFTPSERAPAGRYSSTLTIALPMPISADAGDEAGADRFAALDPELVARGAAARGGGGPSPRRSSRRPTSRRSTRAAARRRGRSTPPTAGSGPCVTMRAISIATAAIAATIIDTTAECGSALTPLAISSATPFHCSAAGNANWSETIVATERTPLASGGRNSRKNSGTQAMRAGEDADHVADRLLARLAAEHVAGLDVGQQVRGVARRSPRSCPPGSGCSPDWCGRSRPS